MLNMPVGDVKKKIQEQAGLSLDEINTKIEDKMKQLAGLISEEGACHIIANELHVQLVPGADQRKLSDLAPGMRDITQAMRVVQVYEKRTFQSKYGDGEGKVCSFLGGDESGVCRVTCWGDHADAAEKLKPQDIVRVKNSYVKENNGRAELHLNDKSSIEVNPEGVTVASGQTQSQGPKEYVRKKIQDLTRGDYYVEILGTVVQAYEPRVFDRKEGDKGVVMNVLVDDGTGNLRCACWGEVAAAALGIDEKTLLDSDGTYQEERDELLGKIVKVHGRAKLNTVYNTIECSVEELDINPDAGEELSAVSAAATPSATPPPQEESTQEESTVSETVSNTSEAQEDVASLDDLEDVGFETPTVDENAEKPPKPAPDAEEDAMSLDDLDDLDDLDI